MSQLVQHFLERHALHFQLPKNRLATQTEIARDRIHAHIAVRQARQQQTLDTTSHRFRALEFLKQRGTLERLREARDDRPDQSSNNG